MSEVVVKNMMNGTASVLGVDLLIWIQCAKSDKD